MTRLFFTLFLGLFLVSCHTTAQQAAQRADIDLPLTVILVRHAEKQSGDNPGLTQEGQTRAKDLAAMLNHMEIDAIFSSDFRRTWLTAEPLAKTKNLEIQTYDHRNLSAFAETLKEEYYGKTVLVSGHSNTTPTLTGLLDGTEAYEGFDESDYGNIMIVTIPPDGPAKTIRLRY